MMTSPSARACGATSCMRLRQRMSVLFPQPDGPMMAITCFSGIVSVMSSSACFLPYQAESWRISMLARSSLVATEGVSFGRANGSTDGGVKGVWMAGCILSTLSIGAGRDAHHDIHGEHD